MIYDGRRWAEDRENRVEAMAKELAAELWIEVRTAVDRGANEKLLAELVRYAKGSNSAAGIRNTLALARSGSPCCPRRSTGMRSRSTA